MKKNSKASVALHTLAHLALHEEARTSEELAKHHDTNPVVIRKILGSLKGRGIVTSEKGHGGGWALAKEADKITFYEVLSALDVSLLPDQASVKGERCLILKNVVTTMNDVLAEAEDSLNRKLQGITIANVAEEHSRSSKR